MSPANRLPDLGQVRKVAILRLDKVGDLLLSTPVIRNVRTALPQAEITLITAPYNSKVLQGWDGVDRLLIYDPDWPGQVKREFCSETRARGVDLCLVLSPIMEAYRLGYATKAPTRAGIVYSTRVVPRLLAPLLLTHPLVLDIDGQLARGEPVPHEVSQMLDLGAMLGLPAEEYPLEVPLDPRDSQWAQEALAQRGLDGPLLAFHLSPKWLTGGWTPEELGSLIYRAMAEGSFASAVVTFGPAEAEVVKALSPILAGSPPEGAGPVSLLGDLPFGRWAGILSQAELVITTDTGALHLAVALGRRVVAVYEHATFAHCSRQWAPWQVPAHVVDKTDPERTQADILRGVAALMRP